MSAYSGRRGPNVSQYLRDLNMVPQESSPEETTFGLDDEQLAMWSNNYFDFDGATSQADLKVDLEPQSATSPTSPAIGDPSFDFVASGQCSIFFPPWQFTTHCTAALLCPSLVCLRPLRRTELSEGLVSLHANAPYPLLAVHRGSSLSDLFSKIPTPTIRTHIPVVCMVSTGVIGQWWHTCRLFPAFGVIWGQGTSTVAAYLGLTNRPSYGWCHIP